MTWQRGKNINGLLRDISGLVGHIYVQLPRSDDVVHAWTDNVKIQYITAFQKQAGITFSFKNSPGNDWRVTLVNFFRGTVKLVPR